MGALEKYLAIRFLRSMEPGAPIREQDIRRFIVCRVSRDTRQQEETCRMACSAVMGAAADYKRKIGPEPDTHRLLGYIV